MNQTARRMPVACSASEVTVTVPCLVASQIGYPASRPCPRRGRADSRSRRRAADLDHYPIAVDTCDSRQQSCVRRRVTPNTRALPRCGQRGDSPCPPDGPSARERAALWAEPPATAAGEAPGERVSRAAGRFHAVLRSALAVPPACDRNGRPARAAVRRGELDPVLRTVRVRRSGGVSDGGEPPFVVDGAEVGDRAVAPARVVPALDPLEDRRRQLGAGLPATAVEQLEL